MAPCRGQALRLARLLCTKHILCRRLFRQCIRAPRGSFPQLLPAPFAPLVPARDTPPLDNVGWASRPPRLDANRAGPGFQPRPIADPVARVADAAGKHRRRRLSRSPLVVPASSSTGWRSSHASCCNQATGLVCRAVLYAVERNVLCRSMSDWLGAASSLVMFTRTPGAEQRGARPGPGTARLEFRTRSEIPHVRLFQWRGHLRRAMAKPRPGTVLCLLWKSTQERHRSALCGYRWRPMQHPLARPVNL